MCASKKSFILSVKSCITSWFRTHPYRSLYRGIRVYGKGRRGGHFSDVPGEGRKATVHDKSEIRIPFSYEGCKRLPCGAGFGFRYGKVLGLSKYPESP